MLASHHAHHRRCQWGESLCCDCLFWLPQLASTLIAIFGFGGYSWPRYKVQPCIFCRLSTGGGIPFYEHKAPIAFTESGSTDSTIGCTCALSCALCCSQSSFLHVRCSSVKDQFSVRAHPDHVYAHQHYRCCFAHAQAAASQIWLYADSH